MNWQPGSCVGPLAEVRMQSFGLVRDLVPHFAFDEQYLADQQACHGGVPQRQYFRAADRRIYRVGRFINWLTEDDLLPPLRASFMDANRDERLFWSQAHLQTLETYQQGLGAYLLPFAFLYNETLPPDEMDPEYMDCLCFDYRAPGIPKVLLWFNDPAVGEYYRCEELGQDPRTQIDYRRCTMPVAESFTAFRDQLFESLEAA